ncbi:Hypothetical protein GSB_152243 [Giardia duodenalis]|uniref:Uncharacterized protein n=2 Tax=Giardia intestinalis TaxID=5741 RepID=C6LVH4_GIAIB|nr:Hypothetical protein GL50581_2780 [Giardia intestinalis ATCC 50581]ESU41514.1 Hypothetical protein GSB_152243 [Giardia intestinalis]
MLLKEDQVAMQSNTKVKVHLLRTLDDGSVDPNCYACKMGHVILTSDGKISSESPAVKDKRLLIKKNGKVDNRSAICKKTVDQDKALPAAQQNATMVTRDNMDLTTSSTQQASISSMPSERKPTLHSSVPPTPPISAAPLSIPDTVIQAPISTPSTQLSSLASVPQPPPPQSLALTHRAPQFTSLSHQERPSVSRGLEHQAHHGSIHSTDSIFTRACIPPAHEFTRATTLVPSGYFTHNFMCFLQRLFHRPVDTEDESLLGLQPFYNCLNQEAKDVLARNLPGCEKELVLRLMGQSLQLISPSALSVIDVIEGVVSEDKPFTNACRTLHQLTKHVRSALLTTI